MQLTDIDKLMKFGEDDELECLAAESFVMPEVAHFLGAAERRAEYKRRQAELKKEKHPNLDEYEIALAG